MNKIYGENPAFQKRILNDNPHQLLSSNILFIFRTVINIKCANGADTI